MDTKQHKPDWTPVKTRHLAARRGAGRPWVIGLWCIASLLIGAAAPAGAAGDAAAGRTFYQNKCLSCHGDAKTKGTVGPSLVGIIGRKAGEAVGGTTSRAMSEADFVWTEAALNEFLASPGAKVHGTIMPVGIQNEQDRENLIAYIKSMQ
jgi:cytochrome c